MLVILAPISPQLLPDLPWSPPTLPIHAAHIHMEMGAPLEHDWVELPGTNHTGNEKPPFSGSNQLTVGFERGLGVASPSSLLAGVLTGLTSCGQTTAAWVYR